MFREKWIKKYGAWLLMILAAVLPIVLIAFLAIIQKLVFGTDLVNENLFTTPTFGLAITFNHSLLLLILIFFLRKQKLRFSAIGWPKYNFPGILRELGIGIVLSVGLYVFKETVLDSFSAILSGNKPTFYSLFNFKLEYKDRYLLFVAFVFPFVEEAIFRGYPYLQWSKKWSPWKINLVTSLLFGMMHVLGGGRGLSSAINATVLGGLYFLIFYWRKNLYASSASHSFYNLMIVLT